MARQNFVGLVVSQGKMQKTVKVRVESKVFNKKINKELFHRKDYLVHDEGGISREGDMVRIESTRPLSKHKFFAIAEIIKNSGQKFAEYESMAKLNVAKEEAMKSKEFLDKRVQRENTYKTDINLLKDIKTIQKALAQGESKSNEDLLQVKKRYGIQDFTQDSIRQLLKLDITELEKNIETQQSNLETLQTKLSEYLANDEEATSFLESHGVSNPSELQRNIKKNLLRKHLLQDLQLST
ncbi:hypothetical protein NCAS_0D03840 [Naumovozyma castellii]|uniref:37S ribosomal protein S17, mitochondrial n=1 Tax=Naumovozyma castellii TaxID=27288 RepID=G0VEH4_NAUCA|nr:hypothetical protein NCAS_0D03840 [Naumovozyma castellii CBS 4309]CCC69965.1 hypothetical protein NCAS_0D03840 [Naumovozyma castellii CBS 4309]